MFRYLIFEIEQKVYKKENVKKKGPIAVWKETNSKDKFLLVLLFLLSTAFFVSSFFNKIISVGIFAVEIFVVIYIKSYVEKSEKNMAKELGERYKKEELKRLKNLLKQPEWKLWNKKGTEWIIQQCDMRIQEKGFIDNIKPFVWITCSAVVMPLVLVFLGKIVEDMEKEILYLFMGIVFIIVFLVISIGFIVYALILFQKESRQNIYWRVREDIQYLASKL